MPLLQTSCEICPWFEAIMNGLVRVLYHLTCGFTEFIEFSKLRQNPVVVWLLSAGLLHSESETSDNKVHTHIAW